MLPARGPGSSGAGRRRGDSAASAHPQHGALSSRVRRADMPMPGHRWGARASVRPVFRRISG